MLVGSADRQLGPAGYFVDRSVFVALFAEKQKARGLETLSLLDAAFLARCRKTFFSGQQIRPFLHDCFREWMDAPTNAPARQHSIQPPNTPATSGDMLGNTTGKNALENGSSNSVGRANENAPLSHCSCGSWPQTRRISKPIKTKLAISSTTVFFHPVG